MTTTGAGPSPRPAATRPARRRERPAPARLLATLLAAAVTGACLWLLLTPQILAALARLVTDASPVPVLGAFVLLALVQWLRAWRFAVMMTGHLALPGAAFVRISFQLTFWNVLLPLRLGELSFPVLMKRHLGYGLLHSGGVLLIARLLDLATVAAIGLGSAAAHAAWSGTGRALLLLGALALALVPLGIAAGGPALRSWLARLPRVGGTAERLTAGFDAIGGRCPALAAVGLGFASWLAFGLGAILVAGAVAATVPPATAMLGAAAGNLAFALPVNGIAGIGPAQAAWVAATTRAGVPWDDAVVSALALHAVVLTNAGVLGGVAMALGWEAAGAPARRPGRRGRSRPTPSPLAPGAPPPPARHRCRAGCRAP